MRLVALSVLLIGNLFAHQVLAEDVIPQPLTRLDCAKAGMAWDDNANVCGAASVTAEAVPSLKVRSRWTPQPNLLPERIALRPAWPGMTVPMSVEQRL